MNDINEIWTDEPTSDHEYTADEVEANEARTSINEDATTPTGMEVHLDASPEPAPTFEDVEAFSDEDSMQEAYAKLGQDGRPLVDTDPAYAAEVEARMEASMIIDDWGRAVFDPDAARKAREAQQANAKKREAARKQRARLGGDFSELRIRGDQSQQQASTDDGGPQQVRGFESEAELTQAVGDPRYETRPSYTRQVNARLMATDWI